VATPAEKTHYVVAVERHMSPQVAAAELSKPRASLSPRQSDTVDFLKKRCPGFAAMRHLVLSFRGILLGGKVSSLQRWVKEAEATGIHAMKRFIRKLKQDLDGLTGGKLRITPTKDASLKCEKISSATAR
jgi:hypothetical protein